MVSDTHTQPQAPNAPHLDVVGAVPKIPQQHGSDLLLVQKTIAIKIKWAAGTSDTQQKLRRPAARAVQIPELQADANAYTGRNRKRAAAPQKSVPQPLPHPFLPVGTLACKTFATSMKWSKEHLTFVM